EKGEWTGVLKKEVKNFEQVLQKVLEQVPSEDIEQYGITISEEADERIEMELEKINMENLGFDHSICLDILDIKSESFTNIPGSVYDIFKEPFQKYKLE
ncbi:13073_t:CDS:2, partial [Funneliformis geosporum]